VLFVGPVLLFLMRPVMLLLSLVDFFRRCFIEVAAYKGRLFVCMFVFRHVFTV